MPIGTIINAGAIILGSLAGVIFHEHIPKKIHTIVFQIMGLATILIGLQMAFKVDNILTLIFSLLIGGIIGELIDLELRMKHLGNFFKRKIKSKDDRFTEGFLAASLLYCIGALAILGPINEALHADRSILYTKSILDGFASIAFASSMGIGVIFASIPVLVYQGTITVGAGLLQPLFTTHIINQLTAVGGLLIVGIGINLLELKKIKVTNILPSLLVIVLFSYFLR